MSGGSNDRYKPVRKYERLTDEILDLQKRKEDVSEKHAEREKLKSAVEKIIAEDVGNAYMELLGENPGVEFRLGKTPSYLTVSRKDRIEVVDYQYLGYADDAKRKKAEAKWEKKGYSALAWVSGGSASTPIVIDEDTPYHKLLAAVGHEEAHHFFAGKPLDKAVQRNQTHAGASGTIEETSCDMFGNTIRDHILSQMPDNSFLKRESRKKMREDQQIAGRKEEILKNSEKLLATGKIDAAESYMKKEQARLEKDYDFHASQPFTQAYFATRKMYGQDTTERKTKELNALMFESHGVKDFADTVSRTTRYSKVRDALAERRGENEYYAFNALGGHGNDYSWDSQSSSKARGKAVAYSAKKS